MANKNITLEQARSLVSQGAMTKKGFNQLVETGQIKVFRFRSQDSKPQIVQDVHAQIVAIIEANAYPLFEAGYKPSIVWNDITEKDNEEAETPAQ